MWVRARARIRTLDRRARDAERLAELGTLTGGLAHEIKNPLSTIQLNLQLLQEDLTAEPAIPPRVTRRLTTIIQETTRLREILEGFLRYAGRIELECTDADLDAILGELVDFLGPQAQIQRVQLRHHPANPPIVLSVDVKLIKQALLNLMINALHAMSGGGELILSVRRIDREVCIDVTDTGPGIAPEEQSRIFEAYYSKKRGGTGLGLAMTRRIAIEHGGRVELQSEVGKGSRFTIVLPSDAQQSSS
ncbi:MAG TPA: ATP-binding protein [Tepidisphaeraceae bacterium]|nr:ATP-binding protein [Tepidisphaeraceae bacterium]